MEILWNDQFLIHMGDLIQAEFDARIGSNHLKVRLLTSSAPAIDKTTSWAAVSAYEASFKGYLAKLLTVPASALYEDGPGRRVDICTDVSFAYDSAAGGSASEEIAHVALTYNAGGGDVLWATLELDSPYTFSSDGHELLVDLSWRGQNPPWPV
jgi:hypothetical protein